jgi:hypothetical protein
MSASFYKCTRKHIKIYNYTYNPYFVAHRIQKYIQYKLDKYDTNFDAPDAYFD